MPPPCPPHTPHPGSLPQQHPNTPPGPLTLSDFLFFAMGRDREGTNFTFSGGFSPKHRSSHHQPTLHPCLREGPLPRDGVGQSGTPTLGCSHPASHCTCAQDWGSRATGKPGRVPPPLTGARDPQPSWHPHTPRPPTFLLGAVGPVIVIDVVVVLLVALRLVHVVAACDPVRGEGGRSGTHSRDPSRILPGTPGSTLHPTSTAMPTPDSPSPRSKTGVASSH